MRCLSSVALPKLLKLKLAANCSAADAMSFSRIGPSFISGWPGPSTSSVDGQGQYSLTHPCRPLFGSLGATLLPFARLALLVHVVGLLEGRCKRAARLFDGLAGRRRRSGHFDLNLSLQLAGTKQAHTIAIFVHKAGFPERFPGDFLTGVHLLLIDRLLQPAQIQFDEVICENIVEATLWHAHVQGHLAAFKTIYLRARTCLGTLHAASRRLAKARRRAAANFGLALVGARIVSDFIELHVTCFLQQPRRGGELRRSCRGQKACLQACGCGESFPDPARAESRPEYRACGWRCESGAPSRSSGIFCQP